MDEQQNQTRPVEQSNLTEEDREKLQPRILVWNDREWCPCPQLDDALEIINRLDTQLTGAIQYAENKQQTFIESAAHIAKEAMIVDDALASAHIKADAYDSIQKMLGFDTADTDPQEVVERLRNLLK